MPGQKCYVAFKGIDDVLSEKLGSNFSMHRIATLRGLYEEFKRKELDVSDMDKAAEELMKFSEELKDKDIRNQRQNFTTRLAYAYKRLKKIMPSQTKKHRVDMISYIFSMTLDSLEKANPDIPRIKFIEGFEDSNGQQKAGAFAIFEYVYTKIVAMRNTAIANKDENRVKALNEVLDNWPTLATYARRQLRETEDMKLGLEYEYAAANTPENFNDNILSETFDISESTREAWMEESDKTSAYSSVGTMVRRALATMTAYDEKNEPMEDDLGFPIMMDPISAHQMLMEVLRGATSSRTMKRAFYERHLDGERTNNLKFSWMQQIIDRIDSNPQFKTQLFVDMKKNFQPYSMLFEDGLKLKTKTINRQNNNLKKNYITRFRRHVNTGETSIYDNNGNVNWTNVAKFLDFVNKYFERESMESFLGARIYDLKNAPEFFKLDRNKKITVIKQASDFLGLDLDFTQIESLLSNNRKLRDFVKNIREIAQHGIINNSAINNTIRSKINEAITSDSSVKESRIENLNKALKEEKNVAFKSLYNRKNKQLTDKEGVFAEKIRKMLDAVYNSGETSLESRALYMDRHGKRVTLYSDVNPSFLGDRLEDIQAYVKENDKLGLKRYIQENYGCSSMFYDNGEWLCPWLRDIMSYCDGNVPLMETPVADFTYERFVGDSNETFENFSSKKHALAMLSAFNTPAEIHSDNESAKYPVFILGDSGVQKTIRARRYTGKSPEEIRGKIAKEMILIYRSELRRRELVKAVNMDMESKHIAPLENIAATEDRFTVLTFLNDDYISPDGKKGKYYDLAGGKNMSEANVEEAINKYLNESFIQFSNEISDLGVTEMLPYGGTSKYFEGMDRARLSNFLADFYYNTKLASICQFQFTTIDPGFYAGTEDLQKRYKEIHAPGSILDIYARDFNGDRYSDDTYETAIYFQDISVNAEIAQKEFMDIVALRQGRKINRELNPNIPEDRAKLIELGKNTKVYRDYKKSSLTDGQGYRSLSGYRKVMGMAGKWTKQMEEVYNLILDARAKYGSDIPTSVLTEIERKSVVFQPIKPFLFSHERYSVNDKDKLLIPTQHKYAEVVLIPELLPKNSILRKMAEVMESGEEKIDLICSTKAVKVGGFGQTVIDYKTNENNEYIDALGNVIKDGKSNPDFANSAVKFDANNIEDYVKQIRRGYVHKLGYRDYRIQTNVPEHIYDSRLFGTQIRKLIMANAISYDKDGREVQKSYDYLEGKSINLGKYIAKKLTGINLVRFYNSLINANVDESVDKFESIVNDNTQLCAALMQSVVNNSRYSLEDLMAFSLDEFGEFIMPLFDGVIEHDASALCFSLLKKIINKQTIAGGSCVQASAYGISGMEVDGGLKYVTEGDNVLYIEAEMPFDLRVKDSTGAEVELKFEDYVNDDGTLKTDDKGNVLLDLHYPGIRDIVAYRIPTENCYSMLNCKVVRFTRKTAGGTFKVPVQAVTQAGFDFDIDKLYFIRKEFKMKAMSAEGVAEVWNDFYEDNPDIKDALIRARIKAEDVQKDITEFFSSLTKTKTIEGIAETSPVKDRLYKYWSEAGLSGTPDDAFREYLLKHPMKYKKYMQFEEYDLNKAPDDSAQTRVGRNNMLLHLIQCRLRDPETLDNRITPGGFVAASEAARIIRELEYRGIKDYLDSNGKVSLSKLSEAAKDLSKDPRPNLDPTDPMTIIKYNQQNQIAGKLIGIFANQNTNHALTSLLKVFKLKTPIAFAGHSYGDLINPPEGVDVNINIAEFLAASVDAVKDPVLNYLNFNTLTADAGALLARIGYTATEIGLLFNQPVIKYICDTCVSKGISLERGILAVKDELAKQGVDLGKVDPAKPSVDDMAKAIANASKDGKHAYYEANKVSQAGILVLFEQINNSASAVSKFVTSTKFTAANAAGSTFGDFYAQQYKVGKYLDSLSSKTYPLEIKASDSIDTPIDDLEPEDTVEYKDRLLSNPLSYEQNMYNAYKRALKALSKYFPYGKGKYKSVRDYINSLCRYGTLDADTINTIHQDFLVYQLGNAEGSAFDGSLLLNVGGENMTARKYFTTRFADDLYDLLESAEGKSLKKFAILDCLSFETEGVEEDKQHTVIRINGIGGLKKEAREAIIDSWNELYSNPRYTNLAICLAKYNFFMNGYTFGPNSFMFLCPTDLRENMMGDRSYTEFLKGILDNGGEGNEEEFTKMFIQNHPNNNRLVWNVSTQDASYGFLSGKIRNNQIIESTIKIGIDELKNASNTKGLVQSVVKTDAGVIYTTAPAFMIDGFLYIANGDGSRFNEFTGEELEFSRVPIYGKDGMKIYPNGRERVTEDTSAEPLKFSLLNDEKAPEVEGDGTSDTQAEIASLKSEIIALLNPVPEDMEDVNKMLADASKDDLEDTLKRLKEELENKEIPTEDSNGNQTILC